MLALTRAAALPLLIVLAGCGAQKTEAPAASSPAAAEESATPTAPLRGIVTQSGVALTFRECGAPPSQSALLTDPRGELQAAFTSLSADPASGIYVELSGSIENAKPTWTALLRAHALHDARACDVPVFDGEFQANGNEPSWAVEIRESGITYRAPELAKPRVFPYALTRTSTGSGIYATKIESPVVSTLEVSLEPARCVDAMSGELRSFKARVTFDGRKLEGCAVAGVPRGEFGDAPLDELNRFAGASAHAVQLWKDPAIAKRLDALLGAEMPAFLENMRVAGPVTKEGDVFYVTGNKPHEGGRDNAFFLADAASNTIEVVLFTNAVRRDLKEGGRDVPLPAEVATMIGNMAKP